MKLLYFAWLRERIGHGEELVDLPPDITTIGSLIPWLRSRGPGYEAAFQHGKLVRCAVNEDFATPDTGITDLDEVAFFPPVTGG